MVGRTRIAMGNKDLDHTKRHKRQVVVENHDLSRPEIWHIEVIFKRFTPDVHLTSRSFSKVS